MFVRSVVAEAFGTNCYVIARGTGHGQEAVVIDPGIDVAQRVRQVLEEHELRLSAILITHGHLDHVESVTQLADGEVDSYIHPADAYRLADPIGTISPMLVQAVEEQYGALPPWQAPSRVRDLADGDVLSLAGLEFTVFHAPGHTEGSVLLRVDALPEAIGSSELRGTLFSGDVLFAGSIGRTDLAGGDHAVMQETLAQVVLGQPDDLLVLPGHGAASTMGRERATNPFLQGLG